MEPAGTITIGRLKAFWADQSGGTALEYCMIGAIVSIVILTAIQSMTKSLEFRYTSVAAALN